MPNEPMSENKISNIFQNWQNEVIQATLYMNPAQTQNEKPTKKINMENCW